MAKPVYRYDSAWLSSLGRLNLEDHVQHADRQLAIAREDFNDGYAVPTVSTEIQAWTMYSNRANQFLQAAQQQALACESGVIAQVRATPVLTWLGRTGIVRALLCLHILYLVGAVGLMVVCLGDAAPRRWPTVHARVMESVGPLMVFQFAMTTVLGWTSWHVLWRDRGWISSAFAQEGAAIFSVCALLLGIFFNAMVATTLL